jgi:hypothetical protein
MRSPLAIIARVRSRISPRCIPFRKMAIVIAAICSSAMYPRV